VYTCILLSVMNFNKKTKPYLAFFRSIAAAAAVARRSVYIIFGIVYARKKKIKMFSSEKTGSRFICTVRFFFFFIFFYTSFAIPPTFLPRGLVSRGGGNNSAHGPLQSHQRQQTLYVSWLGMEKKIEFLLIKPLYYSFNCRVPTSRITMHFTFQETGFNKKKIRYSLFALFPKTI